MVPGSELTVDLGDATQEFIERESEDLFPQQGGGLLDIDIESMKFRSCLGNKEPTIKVSLEEL